MRIDGRDYQMVHHDMSDNRGIHSGAAKKFTPAKGLGGKRAGFSDHLPVAVTLGHG